VTTVSHMSVLLTYQKMPPWSTLHYMLGRPLLSFRNKLRDSSTRCVLCDGSYSANYKGCQEYKKRFVQPIRRDPLTTTSLIKNYSSKPTFNVTSANPSCNHFNVTLYRKIHTQCLNIKKLLNSFTSKFTKIIKHFFSLLTLSPNKTQL
jgi:hypothetical protein